jgi:hypothetical protein
MCRFWKCQSKAKIAQNTARLKPFRVPGDLEIWIRDFDILTDEESKANLSEENLKQKGIKKRSLIADVPRVLAEDLTIIDLSLA